MEEDIRKFVIEFFKSLKCEIILEDDYVIISKVPTSFQKLLGILEPYKLSFLKQTDGVIYVHKESSFFNKIIQYIESSGKTSLLRIDFDIDPIFEINKRITFNNCEIKNIIKKEKKNFFSRFTFQTTFRYLNESEQAINEIYLHNGKIVRGDLSGYKVLEGDILENKMKNLEEEYSIARNFLKDLVVNKTSQIKDLLREKLGEEIEKINGHYSNLIGEIGGGINDNLEKIKDLEEKIKRVGFDEIEILNQKIEKLKKGLLRISNDEEIERILKEKEFTIQNAQQKHSLNIENKLINTTIIYYPVFIFNLLLKGNDSVKSVEVSYDPMTNEFEGTKCSSCGVDVSRISLCSSGHISCEKCFAKCTECGLTICRKCNPKNCFSCGKILCKNCYNVCAGCSKFVCKDHLRRDCVTGEERCTSCLRACMRCHGLSNPKYFGEALDGSKVCGKCLGEERRNKVLKGVFRE